MASEGGWLVNYRVVGDRGDEAWRCLQISGGDLIVTPNGELVINGGTPCATVFAPGQWISAFPDEWDEEEADRG